MLSAAELADMRADLEAELLDRVTVRRQTGETLDEDPQSETYLQQVPTYTTLLADPGPGGANALVFVHDQTARTHPDVADQPVVTRLYMVTLPVTTVDLEPGDEVVVVESHDPRADGRTLWVQDPRTGSISISRRVVCLDKPTGG